MRMPITEERPRFILNLKINDLINARYRLAHTSKQPPQAVISMAGYGLTGKRLQPARLRNYSGLQLRETRAAYGGLRRRLRVRCLCAHVRTVEQRWMFMTSENDYMYETRRLTLAADAVDGGDGGPLLQTTTHCTRSIGCKSSPVNDRLEGT